MENILSQIITALTAILSSWLTYYFNSKNNNKTRLDTILYKRYEEPIKSIRNNILNKYTEFLNSYRIDEEASKNDGRIDAAMNSSDDLYDFANEIIYDNKLTRDIDELIIYYKSVMEYKKDAKDLKTEISSFFSIVSQYLEKYDKENYKIFKDFLC